MLQIFNFIKHIVGPERAVALCIDTAIRHDESITLTPKFICKFVWSDRLEGGTGDEGGMKSERTWGDFKKCRKRQEDKWKRESSVMIKEKRERKHKQ